MPQRRGYRGIGKMQLAGSGRTIKQVNVAVLVGVLVGLGTLMWVPGAGAYVLRRPRRVGGDWKVIGASSASAQKCSYYASFLPRKVMAEFKVTGVRTSSGPLVRCVPGRS